jgi:hypothetical protein
MIFFFSVPSVFNYTEADLQQYASGMLFDCRLILFNIVPQTFVKK